MGLLICIIDTLATTFHRQPVEENQMAVKEETTKKVKEAKKVEDTKAEVAKVEKPKMPAQNGVTRPRPDTLCGQVWGEADAMSQAKGSPVAVADLLVETDKLGLNPGNVRCEYAMWRKFHGVTGRIFSDKQIAERQAKEEAKAKAKEEREAKTAEREAEKAKKAQERAEAKAQREAEKQAKAEDRAKAKAEKEEAKRQKAEETARKKAEAEANKQAKSAE